MFKILPFVLLALYGVRAIPVPSRHNIARQFDDFGFDGDDGFTGDSGVTDVVLPSFGNRPPIEDSPNGEIRPDPEDVPEFKDPEPPIQPPPSIDDLTPFLDGPAPSPEIVPEELIPSIPVIPDADPEDQINKFLIETSPGETQEIRRRALSGKFAARYLRRRLVGRQEFEGLDGFGFDDTDDAVIENTGLSESPAGPAGDPFVFGDGPAPPPPGPVIDPEDVLSEPSGIFLPGQDKSIGVPDSDGPAFPLTPPPAVPEGPFVPDIIIPTVPVPPQKRNIRA
ncbi:hypothetical protein C8J57DRAFT_1722234 [Mycena rebaudengoi]|nr:hypothetical protein C8J57DRAFT_1722234 [Mycena rebaudengoi]